MKCPFVIKYCKKCNRLLVANTMNFFKDKSKKDGFKTICKNCERKQKGYGIKRVKQTAEEKKIKRDANKQKKKEYDAKYYQENKQKKRDYNAKRYQDNKEEISAKHKHYYQNNKEELLEYSKQYYQENKEQHNNYMKKHRQNNKEYYFNKIQERRCKEELQGNGYIEGQWLEMMQYFDWKCAYSGEDLYKRSSTDHIIPISKGGQNNIWNFVPMIKNYNSSKHNRNPLEWYQQQEFYSEERLQKIIEWQQYAYDKWGTEEWSLILIIEA